MAPRSTTSATDLSRLRFTAWCSNTLRAFSLKLRRPLVLACRNHGIGSIESKRDAPVSADPNGPCAPAIALQGMEVVPRKSHLTRLLSNMETRKNQSQAAGVLGLNASRGPATEEAFQANAQPPVNRPRRES